MQSRKPPLNLSWKRIPILSNYRTAQKTRYSGGATTMNGNAACISFLGATLNHIRMTALWLKKYALTSNISCGVNWPFSSERVCELRHAKTLWASHFRRDLCKSSMSINSSHVKGIWVEISSLWNYQIHHIPTDERVSFLRCNVKFLRCRRVSVCNNLVFFVKFFRVVHRPFVTKKSRQLLYSLLHLYFNKFSVHGFFG